MGSKRPARREFLRSGAALAGGFTLGAAAPAFGQGPASPATPASPPMIKGERQGEIAYGARSKHVTSARIPHGGRPSPDNFGLTFHVATPLQDQVGVITPSSLHYFATTRGAFLPDIDPKQHTLMIHGLVDRPLTFTIDDLKRLPSVTRLHFIECAGNRPSRRAKTVQETHGMTSNAEWTGRGTFSVQTAHRSLNHASVRLDLEDWRTSLLFDHVLLDGVGQFGVGAFIRVIVVYCRHRHHHHT